MNDRPKHSDDKKKGARRLQSGKPYASGTLQRSLKGMPKQISSDASFKTTAKNPSVPLNIGKKSAMESVFDKQNNHPLMKNTDTRN